jgi:hypothetical protein
MSSKIFNILRLEKIKNIPLLKLASAPLPEVSMRSQGKLLRIPRLWKFFVSRFLDNYETLFKEY